MDGFGGIVTFFIKAAPYVVVATIVTVFMGLKIFGIKGTKAERQVARLRAKLINPHRQSEDRRWTVDALLKIGTPEAIRAVMERFTFRVESTIHDEEEKKDAVEGLVALGTAALPELEAYVLKREHMYWPLMAYQRIAGSEPALDLLLRALATVQHGYADEERRKAELVSLLREFPGDRPYEELVKALQDENDDVRVMAVEGLTAYGPDKALPALVARLLDAEETPRIRTVILEIIADAGWSLRKHRAALEGRLPAPYALDDKGLIIRE